MEIHEHPIVAGPVGEIRVPIDHRGLSRLLWPEILAALVCASLYLSFIHSETNFWRNMFLLQCFERCYCFTGLVWMPELR